MADPWLVLASLVTEAAIGYPTHLHAVVPHPVVWAGRAIDHLEQTWNLPQSSHRKRRMWGVLAVALVSVAAGTLGWLIDRALGDSLLGLAFIALIGTVGLAQRSLYQHVRDVLQGLLAKDIRAARRSVSLIVGRDTSQLDPRGIAAAALESLAESFNDGVLAPAFWFFIAGLPGLFVYKTLNTADSLIGHREERWRAFGWAAARADDVANLIPARIAGALLATAGGGGFGVMLRDASKHASPNAGWPEAAMAGALGVQLGGLASYDGVLHQRPVFGAGEQPATNDLARGLRIYLRACALMWLALAAMGLTWPR